MTKFNADFLNGLAEDHAHIRKHGVATNLQMAAFDHKGAPPQQDFIDAALEMAPVEFEIILRRGIYNEHAPLADRATSAALYLRGAKLKFWVATKNAGRLAAKLVKTSMEVTMAQMSSEELEATARLRDTCVVLAQATLKKTSPTYRILAVEAWLKINKHLALSVMGQKVRTAQSELISVGNQVAAITLKGIKDGK